MMTTQGPELRRLLTEALEHLDIMVERVRLDEDGSGGGLCTYKQRRIVYLDTGNSLERDIGILTDALRRTTDENTFLVPAVREWLEARPQI